MRRPFNDSSRVIMRSFSHPLALHDDPAAKTDTKTETKTETKVEEKPETKTETKVEEKKSTLLGDGEKTETKTEEKPVEKKVPEKYNLKLPEKSALSKDVLESVSATARELGLPDDASAQKVVDFVNTTVQSHLDAMTVAVQPGGTEWTKNVDQWEADALADKEVGGTVDALQANAKRAQRVLKTFFPQTVATMLHNTGFGSHPDVLRALNKIAKAIGEDKLVVIDAPAEKKTLSVEDKFYAKSTSKEKVS